MKDVITIFHAPSSSVSIRAHTILKQAAANAQSTATIDQAGEHGNKSKTERTDFELGAFAIQLYTIQGWACGEDGG